MPVDVDTDYIYPAEEIDFIETWIGKKVKVHTEILDGKAVSAPAMRGTVVRIYPRRKLLMVMNDTGNFAVMAPPYGLELL